MPVVPKCFLGKWKDPWRGAKEHLRDHSNYVETLCEFTQQSPSCTQTLEQQATGGMDEVGQESEVAIESPSALTLMSPTLLFIHSLLSKLLTRLSFMRLRY